LVYESDANDSDSLPEPLTSLVEDFESEEIGPLWQFPDDKDYSWRRTNEIASVGSYSVQSNDRDRSISIFTLNGLFAAGTLSFDAYLSATTCCDILSIEVNGRDLSFTVTGEWRTFEVELREGENELIFEFYKGRHEENKNESVYVDNVVFTADQI